MFTLVVYCLCKAWGLTIIPQLTSWCGVGSMFNLFLEDKGSKTWPNQHYSAKWLWREYVMISRCCRPIAAIEVYCRRQRSEEQESALLTFASVGLGESVNQSSNGTSVQLQLLILQRNIRHSRLSGFSCGNQTVGHIDRVCECCSLQCLERSGRFGRVKLWNCDTLLFSAVHWDGVGDSDE